MLCAEKLLSLELFQHLESDLLEWICDRATETKLVRGEILVREGDPHRGFFILTSGTISINRLSEGVQMPIGQHQAPSFFGEIQIMTDDAVSYFALNLTIKSTEIIENSIYSIQFKCV